MRRSPPTPARDERHKTRHDTDRDQCARDLTFFARACAARCPTRRATCNASPNSFAVAIRSAGTFSSASATAASTCSGTEGRLLRTGRGRSVRMRAMIACDVAAGVRRLADEHLVGHRAERVHIAPRVDDSVARGLLGTHVLWRAERHAGLRQSGAARVRDRQRNTEIGDDRLTRLEENVLRLEVTVHDPVRVGVFQRVRHADGDSQRFVDGQLLLALEHGAQRLAVDERHDVVQQPRRLARIEQRQNVGMLQIRRDPNLAEKPLGAEDGAKSAWSTLMATRRSCFMSRARYTVAMPPRPISRSIS